MGCEASLASFDDGILALVIVALLVAAGYARHAEWVTDSVAMSILVAGTIAALLENVICFARRPAIHNSTGITCDGECD